jgi:hypothetical protein
VVLIMPNLNALMRQDALQNALLDPYISSLMSQFEKNQPYAIAGFYNTKLSPQEEVAFRTWVKRNRVPFDPNASIADYDMRGFWKGLMSGDSKAVTGINPNDKQLHFSDYYKTPYHKSFSAESKYAKQTAPRWNERDQLVLPDGTVVFDERKRK